MINVGLMGLSLKSVNLGVSALAISQLMIIQSCADKLNLDINYILFTGDDRVISASILNTIKIKNYIIEEPAQVRKGIHGFVKLCKSARKCDVIFDLSLGDNFTDIYGFKRFIVQSLEKYVGTTFCQYYVLAPQTIGPFQNNIFLKVSKQYMKKSYQIYTRDQLSYKFVENIIHNKKVFQASDMAFLLPYSVPVKEENDKLRIGINVSGLLWQNGYTGKNEFGLKMDYKDFIHGIINFLLRRDNYDIYFIAHVIIEGEGDDDYKVMQELRTFYPQIKMAPKFSDPIEAKTFIAGLDLLIGSRMHATIAAISSGVPVIPVSYSRKFEGLYQTLGYEYVISARSMNTEAALEKCRYFIANYNDLKTNAQIANERAQIKDLEYKEQIVQLLIKITNAEIKN